MVDITETVPVTINDLTRGSLTGDGVFDKIMATIAVRLDKEYEKNRIKGTDYSQVYLGTMESAMQQSIVFLLGKDKAANEANLILAQIALAEAQRDKVLAEIVLLELQAPKIAAEIRAIDAQILQTEAEIELTNAKKDLILLQEDELEQKKWLIAAQTINESIKSRHNFNYLNPQSNSPSSFTLIEDGNINERLAEKTYQEQRLVKIKGATEAAQAWDTIIAPNEPQDGRPVAGVIGKQKELLAKQTEGFQRDAEQKVTKLISDIWSVNMTTNELLEGAPENALKTKLDPTLSDLKSKVGLT